MITSVASPRRPWCQPGGRRVHHRRSLESVAVGAACRVVVKNAVRAWTIQPNLRWPLGSIDRAAGLLPRHGSAVARPVTLPHCPAELVRAPGVSARRAVLYLHGGAFLTCGLNTHRSLVARLSRAADAVVLNVGYRLLPAYGLSDAIEDGIDGLRWLRRHGYDWHSLVIAGDSAGGYLAFMTTLELIARGKPRPAGLATISPLTDLDPARKLAHRNARRCSMFTCGGLSMFAEYLGHRERRLGRTAAAALPAPVDADLSEMPPVAIHASADELLLPDAELMAQCLHQAGVRCDLHLWKGQVHDFPLAADVLPEGRRAIRYLGDFVKDVTTPRGSGAATDIRTGTVRILGEAA